MMICKLQNLDQETALEIVSVASGDNNAVYERLLQKVHNGEEVAVLCCGCETESGQPGLNYYDCCTSGGDLLPVVAGIHLQGIENWRD
jgi:hypothetical protein